MQLHGHQNELLLVEEDSYFMTMMNQLIITSQMISNVYVCYIIRYSIHLLQLIRNALKSGMRALANYKVCSVNFQQKTSLACVLIKENESFLLVTAKDTYFLSTSKMEHK